jgi:hypothetical protein
MDFAVVSWTWSCPGPQNDGKGLFSYKFRLLAPRFAVTLFKGLLNRMGHNMLSLLASHQAINTDSSVH